MRDIIVLLGVALAFIILCGLSIKLFLLIFKIIKDKWNQRKAKKNDKPFRIDENVTRVDKHIGRRFKEAQDKISYNIMPVIHFSSTGEPYLIPSISSSESIKYKANKGFTKQRDESKKTCIHYPDGEIEEGWICAEKEPKNIELNPVLSENAIIPQERFTNSFMRLEGDYLRRSLLNMSKEQIRIITLFFISGMGISSIFWVGAIAIFFIF